MGSSRLYHQYRQSNAGSLDVSPVRVKVNKMEVGQPRPTRVAMSKACRVGKHYKCTALSCECKCGHR